MRCRTRTLICFWLSYIVLMSSAGSHSCFSFLKYIFRCFKAKQLRHTSQLRLFSFLVYSLYIYQETLVKNNHPFYFLPAPTPHFPKIKVAGSVRTEGSSCKMSCHPRFSQDREVFKQNVLSSTLQSGQRGLQAKCPVIHTSVRTERSSSKMSCHPHFS